MSENRSSFSNLDQYLKAVQQREKSKFRQRLILLLLVIIGSIGIITVSRLSPSFVKPFSSSVVKASFSELDITSVSDIFQKNDNVKLVIEYPFGLEDDTVSSLDEYLNLVSSEQMELEGTGPGNFQDMGNATSLTLGQPLFFIEGNKEMRNELTFAIANYDTALAYSMNFGNGVSREITNQLSTFSYRSAGTYTLVLTVTDKSGNTGRHQRTIAISAPQEAVTQQNPQSVEGGVPNATEVVGGPERGLLQAAASEGVRLEEVPGLATGSPEVPQDLNTEPLDEDPSPSIAEDGLALSTETSRGRAGENETGRTIPEMEEPNSSPRNTVQNINFASANLPLYQASKMPRFKGGKSALARYFRTNMRYPQEAISQNKEGTVLVRFIIEPDGSISSPEIMEGIGSGCDEEALRLILRMPQWIPGEEAGNKVAVYSQLAIKFELR